MKNTAAVGMGISLIVALVAIGLYVAVFLHTAQLLDTAHSLSGEIAKATNEHAERGANKDAIHQVLADEEEMAMHILPTERVVPFLGEIENLGQIFGSDVAVVSVTDPTPDGRITLALSVVGSFEAVMRTVGYIEHNTHASVTKSLSLDSVDGGLWSAALTLAILTEKTP